MRNPGLAASATTAITIKDRKETSALLQVFDALELCGDSRA
jgi:hypothetical protein